MCDGGLLDMLLARALELPQHVINQEDLICWYCGHLSDEHCIRLTSYFQSLLQGQPHFCSEMKPIYLYASKNLKRDELGI